MKIHEYQAKALLNEFGVPISKGVPVLNGHGKGDLYVEVRVQIPSKLSKRQKELLQELETTAKVDNQPMTRSLLGKVKNMFG